MMSVSILGLEGMASSWSGCMYTGEWAFGLKICVTAQCTEKGGIGSSSSSCLDGIPTQWLLLYYGYNKSWMQYLTQVVGSCCFLILRCWHQGLAKMLLWFCVTFWDGSQQRKPFWGVRVFCDHRIAFNLFLWWRLEVGLLAALHTHNCFLFPV